MTNSPLIVVNPYDQEPVCTLSWDTEQEIEWKLTSAREALSTWRGMSVKDRVRQVKKGLAAFKKDGEAIARDITRQMGKPLAQARNEVEGFFVRADHMVSIAEKALAPDVLPQKKGFHRRIEHEPLGLVFNVAAWNYPLLIPVNVVVPALLAGNVVILKHSARTPLCGRAFSRAFGNLEPKGLVWDVILTHERTAQLMDDPRVDFTAFTGSVEGGREVYKKAAARLMGVGLELGGKDPAYVAEDADMAFAAANIVDGVGYNAGQSCCSVERVYVHKKRYEDFLSRAKTAMEAYRLGDPADPATTMGPLASRPALDLLEARVADAVRRGARLFLGGKRLPGVKGNFFPPTLVADVPPDVELMREETFGPIMPVAAVDDDEEALIRMNDSRYGLTASVWTKSRARAERFARALEAGTVFQNRCDYLDPALAWTGWKESGLGSTLSRYGFLHLTRRKSIHFRA
jgi:acyl-CoA reductase-like NAD-dependent aldehyde dehydrogenase